MSGYSLISILALVCYLLLLVAFLAAKKTKLINSFIFLLITFTMWTLGSFCLRIQLFPSYRFWFYVSIDGLFLMVPAYHSFLANFTEVRKNKMSKVWYATFILIILINTVTKGCFIGAPELVTAGGTHSFVYHIGWLIAIPFFATAVVIGHFVLLLVAHTRKNVLSARQIAPVMTGIFVLLLGNLAASIPFFASFPIDIFSGIINAIFIIYALYNRRLFRLTLLVSRSALYVISAVLSIMAFTYTAGSNSELLLKRFAFFGSYSILAISVSYATFVLLIYFILKKFVDKVFIKAELAQADDLKEFSRAVNKTLKADEIMSQLISIVGKSLHTEKVYICLRDDDTGNYGIVASSSPLDGKSLFFSGENPMVRWISSYNDCVLMEDFMRTPVYKAMWAKEKNILQRLNIRIMLPLINEDELFGIMLLSNKEKNLPYTVQDQTYLQSLVSVSSVAIKNSWLYEKAYREARTDSLTGLLNRKYFYETLEEIYAEKPGHELALIYISIDSFKLYNKLYGSVEGDLALQDVARIISATVGNNGIVSRYEGKTFMVILPGFDTLNAVHLSDRIRRQVSERNRKDKDYSMKMLTCSCGVCAIPTGASNTEQLIANADLALYNAKKRGKNCTRAHSEGPVVDFDNGPIDKKAETDYEKSAFDSSAFDQYEVAINSLTKTIEVKDHFTYGHSNNVCYYAMELGRAYGLDETVIEIIRQAALLHDVGKIGIPEQILCKPSRLTDEEYAIIQGHVVQSIEIIKQLPSLSYVIPAVIGHHERFDGRGYPRGLKGTDIPLLARILCVADSFDAMVSKRIYKSSLPLDYALGELARHAGTQFDPELAPLFIRLVQDGIIKVRRYGEEEA